MGVINVTPDSFSDGGQFLSPEAAARQAERLVQAGADILDLGAESTRPNSQPVPATEEWRRLQPVFQALARLNLPVSLSIDTRKPDLMLKAADLGVTYVNDIEGGIQVPPKVLERLASYSGMQYIAMHMHGTPATMQKTPLNGQDAVEAVDRFFVARHAALRGSGFSAERLWLDPGIGFGKTDSGNALLMKAVGRWSESFQVAVGVSRKGMLGRLLSIPKAEDRDPPSKTLEFGLALLGVKMIRTHDVAGLKPFLSLLGEGH